MNAPISGKSKPSDQFQGLKVKLYLAVGAQVTLTSNINMAVGLTNGAKSAVVDIVYSKNINVDLPDFIIVRWQGIPVLNSSLPRSTAVIFSSP